MMKRTTKALLMCTIAIVVGVGVVYAATTDTYFEATGSTGASASYLRLSKDSLLFPNTDQDDIIRMYDGDDKINTGDGEDSLFLSNGTDAIAFRGDDTSEDGIISFDYCSAVPSTLWSNSTVHMKVDQNGSGGDYAMEIRSDTVDVVAQEGDLKIQAEDGDVIVWLGS